MNEKDLLRLEFDLYSRHHIITQAVRALAGDTPLQLVDAGGRSGLIQTFMPEQDLTVVDIREPETDSDKKLQEQQKYLIGSVLNMPLPDKSVDLALSLEMLEHMTAEERPRALREMLRVSRMGIIFSFPQDSVENDQAERLVNNYYKRLTGEEHPWLKEHIQNRPLPQPEQLEGAMRDLGVEFVRLSSSNTYLWTLMRYYIFSTHGFHTDVEAMFEFYNTHLAKVADAVGPSYRSIYVAVRPEFAHLLKQLPKQAQGQTPMPTEVLTLLDKVFDSFTSQIELKNQHIRNVEAEVKQIESTLRPTQESVKAKDIHIQNIEALLEFQKQTQQSNVSLLRNSQQLNEAKDVHIRNLVASQQSQERNITHLQDHTQQQKEHIRSQEKVITSLQQEILTISSHLKEQLTQKEDVLSLLTEQLKEQEQVIRRLDQSVKDKDTHIRNIQPAFEEMQSFRRYFFMRWIFSTAHSVGKRMLWCKQRIRHGVIALHILRTQGLAETYKSFARYISGTSIVQNPLQANAMPLNEQYKLLRETQLLTKADLRNQKEEISRWKYKPLVSVVIGAYYVDSKWLEKSLESVLGQTYPLLEVIVVQHPELSVRSVHTLNSWAKRDSRVSLVRAKSVEGPVSLLNQGIQKIQGEFVLLTNGNDELSPQAVFQLLRPLQTNQAIDLVYADEDTIQTDGTHIHPHFKTDFNLDLLLSTNYFGHPILLRKSVGESVGWLREELEGAYEYDLWLRCVEKTKQIIHVPHVLYHQRVSTDPLAAVFNKQNAFDFFALKTLEEYAQRNQIAATVSMGLGLNTFRFQRKILQPNLVSIIIPFKDKVELLKKCVPSILNKTDYPNFEILLVSNNSVKKETAEYITALTAADKRIRALEYNIPFNYAQINNWAVQQAQGEYVLLLNNDIEVISNEWLTSMVEHIQRPEVGAVGAQLFYPNNTIQHAGVILGLGGFAGHNHKHFPSDLTGYFSRICTIQNFSAVTGACLLTKKRLFEAVHGLDEKHLAISLNDIDYCLKLRKAGFLITYTPYAKLYHYESISRGFEDSPEKQQRFARELSYFQHVWNPLLQHDPYYNPNLTLKSENFSLNVF